MKKPVSKAEVREQLRLEVERFLQQGGQVEDIPPGVSGRDAGDPPLFLNRRLFIEPREPRTEIPEVLAALDARRKPRRGPVRKRSRLPQPRRKVIYDDFGEPLRKVWVEEN